MAKILLIDDDEAITSVFDITLRKEEFETVIAHTGEEGLEKAKSEKPDLILLDQILPDMTGNEILKKLKEDIETKLIPIAILSNFGQNELISEAMNLGASDYILKYQIEPGDLINKVKGLLKETKMSDSETHSTSSE
ncbi:MAG: response regulator [Candidatus Levybacteria bacterium]|nr:response regulator [Candidatus Levybacteria bacterium]